jgi:uncharacterized protein (UPF0335 family)
MPDGSQNITGQRLRSFIERVERLEEEKAALSEDIKEVYAEAKGQGFDAKVMRRVVAIRKKDGDAYAEECEILRTYMSAIGMQHELPL